MRPMIMIFYQKPNPYEDYLMDDLLISDKVVLQCASRKSYIVTSIDPVLSGHAI
jgi:hypothetical protein